MSDPSGVIRAISLTLAAMTLPTIVIRQDRSDSDYVRLGARYADVLAHVEDRAEGTIVAPRWVLTAAHVVEPIGPFDLPFVTVRGERYGVEKILIHPDWEESWDRAQGGPRDLLSNHDIALLKLDRRVPTVRPVVLYRGRDELGIVLTLLGRGKTGTALTGAVGDKGRVVRGATNRVDGASETALLTIFGAGESATELEGAAGPGDSGGPALVERGDTLYLLGVGSAGTARRGYPMYGTLDIYARVSSFAGWIDSTISVDPPPTVDWSRPVRVSGEGRFPATPAGRLARDFFATYAASLEGDGVEQWVGFYRRREGPDADRSALEERASRLQGVLVEPLGPVEILGYATAGPHLIQVLVRSRDRPEWRGIGLGTDPDRPDRLGRLYMKWESEPEPELWQR